jgi:hypothetical protein
MNPKLVQLSKIIADEGYPTQLLPASEQAPADQLIVQMEMEKTGWTINLELAFLNDLGKLPAGSEEVDFIQFFAPLPLDCPQDRVLDLVRFITLANNALPLVGFGCMETQGVVFFRYLMVVLNDQVRSDEIVETIMTIEYLIETFGQTLKDLADGNKTFEQIVAEDIQWA